MRKVLLNIALVVVVGFSLIGCKATSKNASSDDMDNLLSIKNGDRVFKSEIEPKSEAEKVILESFRIEISDEHDKCKNIYTEKDYVDCIKIFQENFNEGLYTEQVLIHDLKKLEKEEYTNKSHDLKYYENINNLNKFNPKEYEIIQVDYTIKLTDKLNNISQWGNGDWTRYYVMVKESKNSPWKIFDIYGYLC